MQITKLLCVYFKMFHINISTQNPLNTKNGIGASFLNDLLIEIPWHWRKYSELNPTPQIRKPVCIPEEGCVDNTVILVLQI